MAQTPAGPIEDTASSDLLSNLGPFRRHLDTANRSPNTVRAYSEAVRQLDAFLAAQGMPRALGALTREHVEAFIVDQLTRHKPESAANRSGLTGRPAPLFAPAPLLSDWRLVLRETC